MENRKVGAGVGVMILQDGKILLGKRHDDAAKADSDLHGEGTWTMPGGKLHFGETFEGGACREIMEETGLKVEEGDLKVISLSNDRVPDAHYVTIGLLCEKFSGEARIMEPDEITEWQWFSLDKLPEPIFPPCRTICKHYLVQKIYI